MDGQGRPYYVDHNTKQTSWTHPGLAQMGSSQGGQGISSPSLQYAQTSPLGVGQPQMSSSPALTNPQLGLGQPQMSSSPTLTNPQLGLGQPQMSSSPALTNAQLAYGSQLNGPLIPSQNAPVPSQISPQQSSIGVHSFPDQIPRTPISLQKSSSNSQGREPSTALAQNSPLNGPSGNAFDSASVSSPAGSESAYYPQIVTPELGVTHSPISMQRDIPNGPSGDLPSSPLNGSPQSSGPFPNRMEVFGKYSLSKVPASTPSDPPVQSAGTLASDGVLSSYQSFTGQPEQRSIFTQVPLRLSLSAPEFKFPGSFQQCTKCAKQISKSLFTRRIDCSCCSLPLCSKCCKIPRGNGKVCQECNKHFNLSDGVCINRVYPCLLDQREALRKSAAQELLDLTAKNPLYREVIGSQSFFETVITTGIEREDTRRDCMQVLSMVIDKNANIFSLTTSQSLFGRVAPFLRSPDPLLMLEACKIIRNFRDSNLIQLFDQLYLDLCNCMVDKDPSICELVSQIFASSSNQPDFPSIVQRGSQTSTSMFSTLLLSHSSFALNNALLILPFVIETPFKTELHQAGLLKVILERSNPADSDTYGTVAGIRLPTPG
jgi:hypothetical protein